jgi:hypothetical protein
MHRDVVVCSSAPIRKRWSHCSATDSGASQDGPQTFQGGRRPEFLARARRALAMPGRTRQCSCPRASTFEQDQRRRARHRRDARFRGRRRSGNLADHLFCLGTKAAVCRRRCPQPRDERDRSGAAVSARPNEPPENVASNRGRNETVAGSAKLLQRRQPRQPKPRRRDV